MQTIQRANYNQPLWQEDVEIVDLTGHPKANRAYAWSHRQGRHDQDVRFVAIVEIPPVESAETTI